MLATLAITYKFTSGKWNEETFTQGSMFHSNFAS